MTYELAKELKDAGYPQPIQPTGGGKYMGLYNANGNVEGAEAYIPTISQLIEACGSEHFLLCRDPNTGDKPWYARTMTARGDGVTAEETVGHLWLALNKK